MKKVHILIWWTNGRIGAVYADYKKACQAAEKANKKRSWIYRLTGDMKYVVQTFDVQ